MKILSVTAVIVVGTLYSGAAFADGENGWIGAYIQKKGGCLGFDLSGSFLDDPYKGFLFGRIASKWTADDIAEMRKQVEFCQKDIEKRTNSPVVVKEVKDRGDLLILEIPKLVIAARQAALKKDDEHTLKMASAKRDADIALRQQELAEADADRKKAEEEQNRAGVQLKESEAKSQAVIAAAHARRDAALARQKTMVLEAEAKAAVAEAEKAEVALVQPKADAVTPVKAAATGPTFPFSDDQFRRDYNAQLKLGGAGIADCKLLGEVSLCRFDSAAFDKAVGALKELDLVNGRFEDKSILKISNNAGRVAKIVLDGDRSDPANLFQYIGKASALIQSLDSSISDGENGTLVSKDMGLMRGDDDPSIGEEKTIIRPTFAGMCIQYTFSESTKLHCEFVPRS